MKSEKIYMNIETGSTDSYDGWFYENENGDTVNAVDLNEVVEIAQLSVTNVEFAKKLIVIIKSGIITDSIKKSLYAQYKDYEIVIL